MEIIHGAPTAASFVPLSTHQAQTPESFFTGPPVLYHHSPSAKLSVQSSELLLAPVFARLFENSEHRLPHTNGNTGTTNGDQEEEDQELSTEGIDVWVTSERFILFSTQKSSGVSIPYPSISLHAIQRPSPSSPPSLFLQILTQSPTFDDHDPDATISLSLTPTVSAQAHTSQPTAAEIPDAETASHEQPQDPVQELYTALSACANLHPDPASPGSDDEDGGGGPNIMFEGDTDEPFTALTGVGGQQTALPPPMSGSGGWITAENVGEYFDEEGNWRGQSLGEGAGSVRRRDDEDGVDGREGGEEAEGEDAGDGEETKWRRTG